MSDKKSYYNETVVMCKGVKATQEVAKKKGTAQLKKSIIYFAVNL